MNNTIDTKDIVCRPLEKDVFEKLLGFRPTFVDYIYYTSHYSYPLYRLNIID